MVDVARSQIGIATYLAPDGSLNDDSAVDDLNRMLDACLDANEIQIVIDFGNVALVTSRLLDVLLDAQDRLTRVGGSLKAVHANAVVGDVMRITGLENYITLIDGEHEPGRIRSGPREVERGKLGEILVSRGLLSEAQLGEAVASQTSSGRRLGQILTDQGWVSESDLLQVLADQFALPYVRLRTGLYDPETVRGVTAETATRLRVAPLFKVRGAVYLATSDPQSIPSFDVVEQQTSARVKPVLACADEIIETIKSSHGGDHDLSEYIGKLDFEGEVELLEQGGPDDYTAIDEMASGSPVINLINGLIQRAVGDGASDIHIEPSRGFCRVRFRIDGMLYEVMKPPAEVHPALVSRLKVMGQPGYLRETPAPGRTHAGHDSRAQY